MNGVLTLQVEAIQTTGVVFGNGPNPSITGVIGTGGVRFVTSGTLNSPTAAYVFTGDNLFADFTDLTNNQRFRVEWVPRGTGVDVIVNPFGPGPTQFSCAQTAAVFV